MTQVFRSIDPRDGSLLQEYTAYSDAKIEAALDTAQRLWLDWRRRPITERAQCLLRVAELLKERVDDYATLMAREVGKPITSGRAEVQKCAWVAEYYAENAERFLTAENIESGTERSYVSYEPLGAVLAIMPWNFPFWQVFRFAAPTLMAGNVGLLKHAPNVCGCALAIERLMVDAGFPEGLFPSLLADVEQTHRMIADDRVRAVSLTGSVRAGSAVAEAAGRSLKKVVLELGGSDPYLVLADADLSLAADACARSRLVNSGQSCIAAKRILVVRENFESFCEAFDERMSAAKVGDPMDPDTEVGPLARIDLRDALHAQIEASLSAGARARMGGALPIRDGAWYPVTVLDGVKPGMPAFEEELFGPAAAVISVEDEAAGIALANQSRYGLGGAVFTRDVTRGEQIARRELQVGAACVNDFVRSDPRLPFGGVRDSGYGRELGSYGIREFTNVKVVSVA